MNLVKQGLFCLMYAVQACSGYESGQAGESYGANENVYTVLGAVPAGARLVEFYVDVGADSAVLGFAVENDAGEKRYFPMYGSTYRGMPAVTLDVYVSDAQEEMWVHSSWPGYEVLAYHRLGSDRSMTRYGEIQSLGKPTPERLSGGTGSFPAMDRAKVSKAATLQVELKSPR